MTFAICFALNLPAGAIQRTQLALQEGFLTDLWQLLGSVMTLLSLLLGIWFRVGLPILVLAIAGAPVLATALNGIFFFGIRRPDLRPRWRLASLHTVKQIMSVGGLFFVLQIVVSLAFSADGFVVARATGAVNVPEYVIPQRMFSLITMAITMFLTPLWPAYAEAKSRGDGAWVKHTLYKSMTIALSISSIAAIGLLIVSRGLIHWWAGPTINPPMVLLAGLAVWTVMESCGNALAALSPHPKRSILFMAFFGEEEGRAATQARQHRRLRHPHRAARARTPRGVPRRPARTPRRAHRPPRRRPRSRPPRPLRDRPPHRGAAAHRGRGPPGTAAQRGRLGAPVRRRPHPGILG